MRTSNGMLVVVTLIGVTIAFAGNAAAFAEPIFGMVDTTAASGETVMLWVEDDRINNPDQNMSAILGDPSLVGLQDNWYYFQDIESLLKAHGKNIGDPFNVTVAMLCSGQNQTGNPYTNTYHNDTGVTTMDTYGIAGSTNLPMMNMESCAAEETFSKTLYAGWNLISLPLTPSDSSVSAVLSGVSQDAVYCYNATSKQFESADVMEPGTGYFVHATAESTWTYSGTAYTSTSTGISLKQGLNMVGWLNCSKDVGDALSSISGDYYYVAQWNATAQKYEVHNPAAPDGFNDFPRMDRGTGYFISAKQDCVLSESC